MTASRFRRWLLAGGAVLIALLAGGWLYWLGFDLDRVPPANRAARLGDLQYPAWDGATRGRILAVVTSTQRLADGRAAGYELTELSRAWLVFRANGYDVDIASPRGGSPPMVIDDDDMHDADHAFLNEPRVRMALDRTMPLAEVDPARYAAVYFVGGKGAMIDLPGNPHVASIVADIDRRGGVIGAVCHGPAALLGLQSEDGRPWLAGRRVTGFTNDEELFLIENAGELLGGLLQDRIGAAGATFVEGPLYLDNTVVDGRLVTGQNPWSTWAVAEAMVQALGHSPVAREATAAEHAVAVLAAYRRDGLEAARRVQSALPPADTRLLLMHALVAAMRGEWAAAFDLQRLARD